MDGGGKKVSDNFLDVLKTALAELHSGKLDSRLPSIEIAESDGEREILSLVRAVLVSQRRESRKLIHIAESIDSAVSTFRDRFTISANANSDVSLSAHQCDTRAVELRDFARRVRNRANELYALTESVAEATSEVAERGREVTRDSEELSSTVADVSDSASSIASSVKDMDRALSGLATELSVTSAAVTAIDSAIQRIDAGAGEASRLADEMSTAAGDGIAIVRQTAEAVGAVNQALSTLGGSMERLESRSEQVSEITKLIRSIAVQAKLLALNASIQAAHAGDAGRGFAVVAREIKQLSDSTTSSTQDIEAIIRAIRDEIALAAEEARITGTRSRTGHELAVSANKALDEIYNEVQDLRSRIQRISDATSIQATQTTNLKRAIGRVADLAERLRKTSTDRREQSKRVALRVKEISKLAESVRTSMEEQEVASLGIVASLEKLITVAGSLEDAAETQSQATDGLASAVSQIYVASRESQASVATMAYTSGLLEQHVSSLREEITQIRLPVPKRGGSITVPLTMKRSSLDPIYGFSESHTNVLSCIFETLVTTQEGGDLAPCLAERWEVSADGLLWRLFLRRDVLFHHGAPLTAEDVQYSLESLARYADEAAFILDPVRGVKEFRSGKADHISGITVHDSAIVSIELVEPIAFFLGLLALSYAAIVPKDYCADDRGVLTDRPVGTGPYRLVDLDDERVVLGRYQAYRNDSKPYLDQVTFQFGVDPEDSVDGVLDGRFAITKYIPRPRLPALLEDAEWRTQVQSITQPHCQYLLLNALPGRLPTAVRQAISHAIDRTRAVELYSSAPVAVLAEGLIPPTCPGYEPSLKAPIHDVGRARELLEAADYDLSRPLDFVVTDAPWSLAGDSLQAIVEDLEGVGFIVKTRIVKNLNEERRGGDFDVIEASWYGDYLDPDTFTFGPFHSRLGSFCGNYTSPELDSLFESARVSPDPMVRSQLYRSIHHLFFEICPAVVLLHRRDYVIQGKDVNGVQLYPLLPTVRPTDIWLQTSS